MAQSQRAEAPAGARNHLRDGMTQEQAFELDQYEKIIRLRDDILAGTHPTIKPTEEQLWKARRASAPITALSQNAQANAAGSSSSGRFGNANTDRPHEFNPILLEKSQELIRAEFRIQRQRLEKLLSDEAAEAKRVRKPFLEDGLRDLDLSTVLTQALTLAEPPLAPRTAKPPVAANFDTRSDSFDNDTFYSSQHDTTPPQSSPSARDGHGSGTRVPLSPRNKASASHRFAGSAVQVGPSPYAKGQPPASISSLHVTPSKPAAVPPPAPPAAVPGLQNHGGMDAPGGWQTSPASGGAGGTNNSEIRPFHVAPTTRLEPVANESYTDANPPSPFIQPHDLEATAPRAVQPIHQNIQVAASYQPYDSQSVARGPPGQVANLRNEPQSATSTDSSTLGNKTSPRGKDNGKKKKRKADKQGREHEHREAEAVFIKPEPRSPSPVTSTSYIRPSKRQRHAQRPETGIETAYDSGTDGSYITAYRGQLEGPSAAASIRGGPIYVQDEYAPAASVPINGERRVSGYQAYDRPPHPPGPYHYPHEAVGVVPAEGYSYDGSGYPGYAPRRISMQTPAPQRIYVDHLGNESLHPPPRAVVRPSVAPAGHYTEPQIAYERPTARAASRYAEPARYAEGAPPYARSMSMHPAPRRVVTQPEYATRPYEEPRQLDYAPQHMPPPPGHPRRLVELSRPEYTDRAASARPGQQHPGAEYPPAPHDFGSGSAAHGEQPERIYLRDVSNAHQATAQPYGWGYERHATEHPAVRQEPTAAPPPPQQYYVEPPRAPAPEVMYANDPRRGMYQ